MGNDSLVVLRKVMLITAVLVLQGCVGSDMSDLESFVANAHKDKKPEIEPLPEIPPFKAFEYEAADEADPFSTKNIIAASDNGRGAISKRPDSDRRRQKLEDYPLDALRMVGTITKAGVPHVVVEAPGDNGTVAVLATLGNYMGQNDGKIREIIPEEQRIVLVETVLDPSGRWVTRDVEMVINE